MIEAAFYTAQRLFGLSFAARDDLPVWHAALARDLSIRFEEPSVQFDIGQSVLKPEFSKILSNFFPRVPSRSW